MMADQSESRFYEFLLGRLRASETLSNSIVILGTRKNFLALRSDQGAIIEECAN
jgi:hypothetical protein